jgi:uncharacterized membrane protein
VIGASRPEASAWAGGRHPAARAVAGGGPPPGERPPILHYSPELRPLLAVALGCHGNPDRCLAIGRRRTPICARCVGFVGGNMLGLAALLALGPATWAWALAGLALLAPVAVDGSLQIAGRLSTNPRRLATGLLGGAGQILILGAFLSALTPRLLDLVR